MIPPYPIIIDLELLHEPIIIDLELLHENKSNYASSFLCNPNNPCESSHF